MFGVAFFSNQFARKQGTGVARYAHGLLDGFAELDAHPNVIPVATWSNRHPDDLAALKAKSGLRLLPTRRWLSPFLWLTIGYPKLEQLLDFDVDIVHANDLDYRVSTSKPYVVTVHDIGPLIHPEFFRKSSFYFLQKNLVSAIKKVSAFICVSQSTEDTLREYVQEKYSVDLSDRTYVTYEGISPQFSTQSESLKLDFDDQFDYLHQPFILAVGKISPRKNLEVVIKALKKLNSSIPHHLVTVGGDGWDFQNTKSLAESLGLSDRVHFRGFVSDITLNALYKKATLFIYPSLFEGFGLPVLEAMASGCPVITSNISSLPEVSGEAALLIDPQDVDEVASAIEAICKNQSLAAELKRKGLERAGRFSWKKCAQETLKVYEKFVN